MCWLGLTLFDSVSQSNMAESYMLEVGQTLFGLTADMVHCGRDLAQLCMFKVVMEMQISTAKSATGKIPLVSYSPAAVSRHWKMCFSGHVWIKYKIKCKSWNRKKPWGQNRLSIHMGREQELLGFQMQICGHSVHTSPLNKLILIKYKWIGTLTEALWAPFKIGMETLLCPSCLHQTINLTGTIRDRQSLSCFERQQGIFWCHWFLKDFHSCMILQW